MNTKKLMLISVVVLMGISSVSCGRRVEVSESSISESDVEYTGNEVGIDLESSVSSKFFAYSSINDVVGYADGIDVNKSSDDEYRIIFPDSNTLSGYIEEIENQMNEVVDTYNEREEYKLELVDYDNVKVTLDSSLGYDFDLLNFYLKRLEALSGMHQNLNKSDNAGLGVICVDTDGNTIYEYNSSSDGIDLSMEDVGW